MEYSERTIEILKTLIKEGTVSGNYLADKVGVSSRTIYTDISKINSELIKNGAKIVSRPRYGITLNIENDEKFKIYFEKLQSESLSSEDRVREIAVDLLTGREPVKIDDLSEKYFVSRSTMQSDLKKVREIFSDYHLSVISKPYEGLHVEGKEKNFRRCLVNLKKDELIHFREDQNRMFMSVSRIVNQILTENEYRISEIAFHNLVVHIYISVLRIQVGNELATEFASIPEEWKNSRESRIAEQIAFLVGQEFQVGFSDRELNYLLIHLIGKKTEVRDENTVIRSEVYEMVQKILEEINQNYMIDLRHDFELITMLALHLAPLEIRMLYEIPQENPILDEIRRNFPLAFEMAHTAGIILKEEFGKEIPPGELAYIALYLNVALERYTKKHSKKHNILIVCGTGRGSAQLLAYQLQERYGKRLGEIHVHEGGSFQKVNFDRIDYVLTTVQISEPVPVPIIEFDKLLEDDDRDLEAIFEKERKDDLIQMFQPQLFFSHLKSKTKEEVLSDMVSKVAEVKEIPDQFLDLVFEREKAGSTSFGNLIAIPHPLRPVGEESFVAVGILDEPIRWDNDEVQMILLLSMKEEGDQNLRIFYKSVGKLIMNRQKVRQILEKPEWTNLLTVLDELS